MSIRSIWIALAAIVLGIASYSASPQGMTGFMKNSPVAYFKEDDFKLMREAITAVLESEEPNASRTWENSATGNSGKIQVLKSFQSEDGRDCKQIRIDNKAKKAKGSSKPNICREPGGDWRFNQQDLF
jgi:surface antigen